MGDLEKSLPIYDQVISLDENNSEAYANKAITLSKLGKFDEANSCIDRAITIDPDKENDPNLNIIKANVSQEKGDFDNAIELYDKVLKNEPDNEQAIINKAICLLKQQKLLQRQ